MKLLLDECTPKRLRHDFHRHEVQTVDEVGLKGVLNGELLRAAVAQQFDVLITVDRRIPFQQNLSQFDIAVIILVARPCRYAQLRTFGAKRAHCFGKNQGRRSYDYRVMLTASCTGSQFVILIGYAACWWSSVGVFSPRCLASGVPASAAACSISEFISLPISMAQPVK